MISYAQNGEDVILARLFAAKKDGRYVDIGAGDPARDSVTRHFYEAGWSGVNVEPAPALAEALRTARPRDLTIEAVVGSAPGTARFHVAVEERWGWSTGRADFAEQYHLEQLVAEVLDVPAITLDDVFARCDGPIDFVKIDVEGMEADVVVGARWDSYRPRVVVVEAIAPVTREPCFAAWEPTLLEAGYRPVLFDGLNRFYVGAEDAEAIDALSTPMNVFDEVTRYEMVEERARWTQELHDLQGRLSQLESELKRASEYALHLEAELRQQVASHVEATAFAEDLQLRILELEADNDRAGGHIARLERRWGAPARPRGDADAP